MRAKKLIFSLIVAMLFYVGIMSTTAFATIVTIDGFEYGLDSDGTANVRAYGGSDTELNIPKEITYEGQKYTVDVIANGAFKGNTSLTSIKLPDSVTEIGQNAFEGCTSLSSIEFPNSLTTIGHTTFKGCTSLSSIEFPNSLTAIGFSAFEGCTSLTSIELPNSLTTIDDDAFKDCTSLTSIELPSSITLIKNSTFKGCTSLTSIELPNSLTIIGFYAFLGCTSLSSIEFPNSVTSIEYEAFSDCTSLQEVVFLYDAPKTFDVNMYSDAFPEFSGNFIHKLVSPKNATITGTTISWDLVEIAEGYEVEIYEGSIAPENKVGNSIVLSSTTNSYDLGSIISGQELNSYCITVTALATGYTDSEPVVCFSVIFDTNGHGTTLEKQVLLQNSLVQKPTKLTEIGYIFEGWYKEAGCVNQWDFANDTVTTATVLYAKWTECDHANSTVKPDCENSVLCSICNKKLDALNHDYAITWTQGNDTHYYECSRCTSRNDEGFHKYDNACDTTCNICDAVRVITHNYSKLEKNNTEHWYECSVCNAEQPNSRVGHSGGTATCTEQAICTLCNTKYGTVNDENHDYASVWTQETDVHYYECSRCKDKQSELPHQYDNACDTTCNICDAVRVITHNYSKLEKNDTEHWYECSVCNAEQPNSRVGHSGGTATCTEQAICTLCNTKYGNVNGHGETELRGVKVTSCKEAGYTGDKHCKVCGELLEKGSEITKLDHSYEWKVDKEATTIEIGIKHEECTVCGNKRNENTTIPQIEMEAPETGDDSNLILWIVVLIISVGCVVGILLYSRKRK